MVRELIDLEAYKWPITQWIRVRISDEAIIARLEAEFEIRVSTRTLRRRLQEWKITRYIRNGNSPEVRILITTLYRLGCTDIQIVEDLKSSGIEIGLRTIARIRLEIGLTRRMTTWDRKESDMALFNELEKEIDDGRIEGYGREFLNTYFRRKGHIVAR